MNSARSFVGSRFLSWSASWSVVLATLLSAPSSSPAAEPSDQDRKACLQAYDSAQRFRQDDRLLAAKQELLVCARDVCPSFVRQDCTQWYAEVEKAIPTVVLEAKGPDGSDAIDVKVFLDDEPFVNKIDGKAVPVDPGVHVFRFEMQGLKPVSLRVVVHEAVKNRHIEAKFEPVKKPAEQPKPATVKEQEPSHPLEERQEQAATASSLTLPIIFGGVGVAGIAGFAYFGMAFDSKMDELDRCKPRCAQSDVDEASRDRTFALVSGGIGVVSLGVATYLFLAGSGDEQRDTARNATMQFGMVPLAGGTAGVVAGTF